MAETENNKKVYDLEEHAFIFAKDAAIFCRSLLKTLSNIERARQLIRSSAFTDANYIEANEVLSKKIYDACTHLA